MADRENIQSALRACAEHGVPEVAVPWPEIRDRVRGGGQTSAQKRRFVPRTRLGWAFVAVAVMLFGTGAYAGTGWVTELFGYTAPEIEERGFGVPINMKRNLGGATVTLDKVYADQGNLVIGYSVEGGMEQSGLPKVTDDEGRTFEYVGGLGQGSDPSMTPRDERRFSDLAFLEPSRKLQVAGSHRFRLDLGPASHWVDREGRGPEGSEDERLVFDFEVPVREMQTIQVGQTVEAKGIPMTLERVENSPARTEAILCFDPPWDEEYTWVPVIPRPRIAASDVFGNDSLYGAPTEQKIGCIGYDLFRSVHDQPGRHTLTVTSIEGRSPSSEDRRLMVLREKIDGPWTFEFEVPDR